MLPRAALAHASRLGWATFSLRGKQPAIPKREGARGMSATVQVLKVDNPAVLEQIRAAVLKIGRWHSANKLLWSAVLRSYGL